MKIIFDIFNPTDKLTFLKHHFYKKKQKKNVPSRQSPRTAVIIFFSM